MSLDLIALLVLFLLLSSLFSSSETAFLSLNRYRISARAKKGDKKAKGIKLLLEEVENFLSTILIGNTISNTAFASIVTFLFTDYIMKNRGEDAVLWATITSTVVILIFSEMLPKTIAANYPEQLSNRAYPFIKFFYIILKPFTAGFTLIIRGIMRVFKLKRGVIFPSPTREEIKTLVLTNTPDEKDFSMLKNLFLLEEKRIGDIMVPRVKIVALKEESTIEEIMEVFKKHRYSRYPIYKKRLDQVTGILNIKDVLGTSSDRNLRAKDFAREANFLPVYAKLSEAFQVMRRKRIHLALVVDEFGALRGLVTLEDIIEEVMGEIWDEHELMGKEKKVEKISDNLYLIDGDADISEVEKELNISLPREGYSTFAGFVFTLLERVPREGENFQYAGWYFRIRKMNRNTIELIEARRKNENSGDE